MAPAIISVTTELWKSGIITLKMNILTIENQITNLKGDGGKKSTS